jgi:hypothetical protein
VSTAGRLRGIVAVQLESIVGRRGTQAIGALVLTALVVSGLGFLVEAATPSAAQLHMLGGAVWLSLVVAALLPGVVWHRLPPGQRLAMHTLPVDRRTHELLRVACGGILLIAVTVALLAVGLLVQARLAPPARGWPGAFAWLLAPGSIVLMYIIGSIAGVLTRSATSTLLRIVVWGFAAAMVLTAVGQEFAAWLGLLQDVGHAVLWGPLGIWTALTTGGRALGDPLEPVGIAALVFWLGVTTVILVVVSGRLPRRGRG